MTGGVRRVVADAGEAVVETIPPPVLPTNGYLVQACWSLISPGTELGLIRASAAKGPPRPLGYSLVGPVIGVGADAPPLPPGQLLACSGYQWAYHTDMAAMPPLMVAPVPAAVDPREATFTTLGALAIHALRQGQVTLGDKVVIIGLGLVGQLLGQVALAAGADVLGLDPVPSRQQLARQLGITVTHGANAGDTLAAVQQWSDGLGADRTFLCTSGGADVVELACALARDRGRIVIVGTPVLTVPREPFFAKELTLAIARAYGPGRYDPVYEEQGVDYPVGYVRWTQGRNRSEFLRLLAHQKVRVAPLITHTFELDDAPAAYKTLAEQTDHALAVLFRYAPVHDDDQSWESL